MKRRGRKGRGRKVLEGVGVVVWREEDEKREQISEVDRGGRLHGSRIDKARPQQRESGTRGGEAREK